MDDPALINSAVHGRPQKPFDGRLVVIRLITLIVFLGVGYFLLMRVTLYPVIHVKDFAENTKIFNSADTAVAIAIQPGKGREIAADPKKLKERTRKIADDAAFIKDSLELRRELYSKLLQTKKSNDATLALLWILLCALFSIITLISIYHFYRQWELNYVSGKRILPLNFEYCNIVETIKDLDHSIRKYNTLGMVSVTISVFGVIIFGSFVFNLFSSAFRDIEIFRKSDNALLVIIILLLRTSLLGTFIVAFIVYSSKFSNASFDQAVRFNKRKHATLFLLDLFERGETLPDVMNAFKEWNVSVESAYTDVRLDSRLAKTMFERMKHLEDLSRDLLNPKKPDSKAREEEPAE